MEFAMLIMRSRKRQIVKGIELPIQKRISIHREKENYKYSGILEVNTIKQAEMKEKITKVCLYQIRKILKIKLYSRKFIERKNTRAI